MTKTLLKSLVITSLLTIGACGKSDSKTLPATTTLGVSHGECSAEVEYDFQGLFDSCHDLNEAPSLEDRDQYLICENKLNKFTENYPNVGCSTKVVLDGEEVEGKFEKVAPEELEKLKKTFDLKLNNFKGSGHCGLNVLHRFNKDVLLMDKRQGLSEPEIEKLFTSNKELVLGNIEVFLKDYSGINCTIGVEEYDEYFFPTDKYDVLLTEEVLTDISNQIQGL